MSTKPSLTNISLISRVGFITFVLFSFINVSYVQADEYHYKNILIGTKAIGLGGAFTSIADDMSAVFYNPAGLSRAKLNNSASLSTFAWEESNFEDVFSNDADFARSSFSIVPSFLGTGKNTDRWHWSLVFAVSDLSTERNFSKVETPFLDPSGSVIGTQTEFGNIDLDNASYELGIGTAVNMTDTWSFGGALIVKYKQFETVQGSGISLSIPNQSMTLTSGFNATRRLKDENVIVSPQIGILYKGQQFSWGLKASQDVSLSRNFSAVHQINLSSFTPLPPHVTASSVGEITGTKKQEYATNVSTGVSMQFERVNFSFDIDYYSNVDVDEYSVNDFHPPITRDIESVTNYSLGATYRLNSNNLIRFGIFTDNSNGKIDLSLPYQRAEHINMLGYSISFNTNKFGFPLSVGAYYKYGTGQIRLSDIRVVENIVGLPLYPASDNFDINQASKKNIVLYLSANF